MIQSALANAPPGMCSGDPALVEGLQQCVVVRYTSARSHDKYGGRFHRLELRLAEQAARLVRHGRCDYHEITLLQKLLYTVMSVHLVYIGTRRVAAAQAEDAHMERLALVCQVGPGVAQADDSYG
jgi:hypothetical protein